MVYYLFTTWMCNVQIEQMQMSKKYNIPPQNVMEVQGTSSSNCTQEILKFCENGGWKIDCTSLFRFALLNMNHDAVVYYTTEKNLLIGLEMLLRLVLW